MSKNEENIIKIGNFIRTKDRTGKLIQGKILSISELKNSLWISIKTPKGVRTIKLVEVYETELF